MLVPLLQEKTDVFSERGRKNPKRKVLLHRHLQKGLVLAFHRANSELLADNIWQLFRSQRREAPAGRDGLSGHLRRTQPNCAEGKCPGQMPGPMPGGNAQGKCPILFSLFRSIVSLSFYFVILTKPRGPAWDHFAVLGDGNRGRCVCSSAHFTLNPCAAP